MGNLKGFIALVGAGLVYASFGIMIRLLGRELTDFQQMVYRYLFAALFALAIILAMRQKLSLGKARALPLTIYLVAFPVELYLFMVAALTTNLSMVIFAFYGASLVSSLFVGLFIFKEKITTLKLICLLITVMGFICLGYPFGQLISLGFLAAAGAGVLDTVTNSARKYFGGKIDKFVTILLQCASSCLIMLVLLVASGQRIVPATPPSTWLILVIFGLLLILVNYLILVGFHNFDLNLGTIALSSEMVFTPIFAFIAFGELPPVQVILGGLLIAASIVLVNSFGAKPKSARA